MSENILPVISSRKFMVSDDNSYNYMYIGYTILLVTIDSKDNTVKDRNGMDLTKAEDIKKRWQEYTELLKKRPL